MASKKTNKKAEGGRVKANLPKHGVTKNRNRRYDCGGKLKTK